MFLCRVKDMWFFRQIPLTQHSLPVSQSDHNASETKGNVSWNKALGSIAQRTLQQKLYTKKDVEGNVLKVD